MENCKTPVSNCKPNLHCSASSVSNNSSTLFPSYQVNDCAPCSFSNVNFNNVLNLSYSDLPSTCYNYFLYGFRDERDFEEFKQDLRDFLRLKKECWAANHRPPSSVDADLSVQSHTAEDDDAFCDLNEELEVICRPNNVCKNRRRFSSSHQLPGKRRFSSSHQLPGKDLARLKAATQDLNANEISRQEKQNTPFQNKARFERADGLTGLPEISLPQPVLRHRNLNRLEISNTFQPDFSKRDSNFSKCVDGDDFRDFYSAQFNNCDQPRQDSFGLREDFKRRSGLFEPHHRANRRSSLALPRSSISHILMEFINGDEHFREFDRVFETVNGSGEDPTVDHSSVSAEEGGPTSNLEGHHTENYGNSNNNDNDNVAHSRCESDDNDNIDNDSANLRLKMGGPRDSPLLYPDRDTLHRPSYVDDMLADFFDNDETFLEFEQEFQKFKANRRSQMLLRSLSNMGSSKDIFGDLKAFCDRTLQQKERQRIWRMSSSKATDSEEESIDSVSHEEAKPICHSSDQETAEAKHEPLIWRSVEDWERMLRKMKRNSRLLLDGAGHHGSEQPHHQRRSIHGLSRPRSSHGKQYDRTQSLADLTRCREDSSIPSEEMARLARTKADPATSRGVRHSCCSLDSQGLGSAQDDNHKRMSVPDLAEPSRTSSDIKENADKPKCGPDAKPRNISLEECKEVSLDDLLPTPKECKAAKWSQNFSVDSEDARYSSTSTLCSSNGGDPIDAGDADNDDEEDDDTSSFAFSCSLGSDLHIHEEGDYTDDDLDPVSTGHALRQYSCPPSTRSRSLVELNAAPGNHREDTSSLHATHSASNIRYSNPCCPPDREASVDLSGSSRSSRPSSYCRAASVPCNPLGSSDHNLTDQQPHRPTSSATCDEPICDNIYETAVSSRDESVPRPPSAVSDRLSDLESNDTYDTATSDLSDADLSDHFSTAKSDLSAGPLAAASAFSSLSSRSRSFDLDLSDISGAEEDEEDDFTPGSSPPDSEPQWARHGVKDITARYEQAFGGNRPNDVQKLYHSDPRPYSRGHCHSYHGREYRQQNLMNTTNEERKDINSDRPLPDSESPSVSVCWGNLGMLLRASGHHWISTSSSSLGDSEYFRDMQAACQYTCHQHCVPKVNLNCKSIQDDGAAVVSTVTPTTSSSVPGDHGNQASPPTSAFHPRGRLEPSRSLGQLSARPGSATRLLPGEGGSPTQSGVAASSYSQLQYHPLQQEGGGTGQVQALAAVKHQYKHLSRSASDGFVTVPPSGDIGQTSSPPPQQQHGSPSRHILSPSSSSSFSPLSTSPRRRQSEPSSSPAPRRPDTPPPPPGAVPQNPLEHAPSPPRESNRDGETTTDAATEKDETDSGYRSGTIPDEKLPKVPSQATLDRQELKRKITKYNHFVPAASFEITEKEAFQGFVKVTMNLIRPITMELGARPPSIYELLTREHIVEENTQHVAFYMPRDTHKSLHITSDTTTKEVITSLLKKFHILDHPRKFAMYDQEFNDKNKLVRLRRLNDKDFPLRAILDWDPERIRNYRLVLQENETGEIVWDAFSLPELSNFMRVLDREEKETILELRHKYAYMRQYMERRLAELRGERRKSKA
ncbi:Ras and EF-hand domain-containing protein-like [Elysia marginata]|uniref:Ras and EF-hand domain-containing protein-like n=1 Tax=Elysia marginata TaxID=1093978 RepID=A0AAV4JLG5_9GAST|nr:Ras and EF-hand domain-containing protein-like [Elysia marginata]